MPISGVYAIVNVITGHRYIGSSKDVRQRVLGHKHSLRMGKHHAINLQKAWNEYGEKSFEIQFLNDCEPENLITTEQQYIDSLCPEYNSSPTAGSALGFRHKEESRKKMSESFKNRRLSEETKRKIGLANLGKKMTPEQVEKSASKRRGKKMVSGHTLEWREKVSRALMGHEVTPETRAKISAGRKGWKPNEVTLARLSASHIGKKQSEETKAKRREAMLAYHRNKRAGQETNDTRTHSI